MHQANAFCVWRASVCVRISWRGNALSPLVNFMHWKLIGMPYTCIAQQSQASRTNALIAVHWHNVNLVKRPNHRLANWFSDCSTGRNELRGTKETTTPSIGCLKVVEQVRGIGTRVRSIGNAAVGTLHCAAFFLYIFLSWAHCCHCSSRLFTYFIIHWLTTLWLQIWDQRLEHFMFYGAALRICWIKSAMVLLLTY